MSATDARNQAPVPDPSFTMEEKIMPLFIDNAKTYTQISSAALALTITFVRDVLGVKDDEPIILDRWLIAAWVLLLVAVGSGVYYQYLGVKFLEWKSGLERSHSSWPVKLIQHPWPIYGLMLISFYVGMILFAVSAIVRLGANE
jgi:hypothetical protein